MVIMTYYVIVMVIMTYYVIVMAGELLMGLQDVKLLPSRASFPPHFIQIVVEVKASGSPHVLKLWLVVRKGMLPVKQILPQQSLFLCQSNFMEIMRLLQR